MVATLCNFFLGGMGDDVKDSRDVKRKALEEMLTDTHETKWEREFRVFFDGTKPIGLGFRRDVSSAGRRTSTKMGTQGSSCQYECTVKDIADVGLAIEYNDRCLDIGDYSRVIVENLRVRKINHEDLDGVPFAEVMKKMHAAKPAFFLTFADIYSRPIIAMTENIASNRGSIVSIDPNRRRSSMSMGSGIIRHRQSTIGTAAGMGKRPSVTADPSSGPTPHDLHTVETLANDLTNKNQDLMKQLEVLREQNLLLKQENEDISQERDTFKGQAAAAAAAAAAAQRVASLIPSTPPPVSATIESNTLQFFSTEQLQLEALEEEYMRRTDELNQQIQKLSKELADAKKSLTKESNDKEKLLLKEEKEKLLKQVEDAEAQAKQEKLLYEEKETLVNQFLHDKEALELAFKDLKVEYHDLLTHMEELHDQLVEAQTKAREADSKVQVFETKKQNDKQVLELIKKELDPHVPSSTSVLDRILMKERRQISIKKMFLSSNSEEIPEHLQLLARLSQEHIMLEKQRDELTLEISCHEQHTQSLEEEIDTLKIQVQLYKEQIQAISKKDNLHQVQATSQVQQQELSLQMDFLEKTLEEEQVKKEKLQQTLDAIEQKSKAHMVEFEKEKNILHEFKQKLSKGIVMTKYGSTRGQVQKRVIYCDPHCQWISWMPPGENSLIHPRKGAKANVQDLADVLPGAVTETFQKSKQPPENPNKCFSLVFVHPCRTLDIEAMNMDQRNQLLRGFQLLHEEVSKKRTTTTSSSSNSKT